MNEEISWKSHSSLLELLDILVHLSCVFTLLLFPKFTLVKTNHLCPGTTETIEQDKAKENEQ